MGALFSVRNSYFYDDFKIKVDKTCSFLYLSIILFTLFFVGNGYVVVIWKSNSRKDKETNWVFIHCEKTMNV